MADNTIQPKNTGTDAATQAGIDDMVAKGQNIMALQKVTSALNEMIGITSGIAALSEALGTAAKNRGEAAKSEV